jgi:alpha-mannosidase
VEPGDTPAEAAPPPEIIAPGRWRPVALIPYDGREPEADLTENQAVGAWAAVSALWHPALLCDAAALPRIEPVEFPSHPDPDEVRVVAAGATTLLPSGYRVQVAEAGVTLIDGELDRHMLARRILESLPDATIPAESGEPDTIVDDFFALGTARWWLRDLTAAMGHADCLDEESLTREALTGARAWRDGDRATAANRLRASFELLTQARERFYPVDAYLLDLTLLDPNAPAGVLAEAIESRAPLTLVAPARAIENLALRDPERLAQLREAINEGWADVAGGAYGESDEPLRPLESVLWQFRKGSETYRKHIDDRNVETFARRRFGLYPQLPQIAKRFGLRFGLHLGLDDGRFPVPYETKRLWESPDGSNLEAMTRAPISADRASEGLRLPWRIGKTMKDDHVATITLVHWPNPVAGWYVDLRRIASYSPVMMRLVMASDYFHLTDRPYEVLRPTIDEYQTPYLAQAVHNGEPTPISRRVVHAGLRSRFEVLSTLDALRRLLDFDGEEGPDRGPIEDALESGRFDEATAALDRATPAQAESVAKIVTSGSSGGEPGFLVVNTLGIPRKAPVLLPDAAINLTPDGQLRASQFTEEGVWGVVDLPAFGYSWVSRDVSPDASPIVPGTIGAKDQTLRNESIELQVDAVTGGIRSFRGTQEEVARIGQQIVIVGADGDQASRMRCDKFEVEYGGPALVQAVSEGILLHPNAETPLARFRQRVRLWSGRKTAELQITLSDLDTALLDVLATGDPWKRYIACRWAWPDAASDLRRSHFLAPEVSTSSRPETPDIIDISTRRHRTAILCGGLAHHRRHGGRMLDTLLVAGRESAREFSMALALDQEYPYQSLLDWLSPALVIPTEGGPPSTGPTGWFCQIENRGTAITHVEPLPPTGDEPERIAIAFNLLETSGRASRSRLRLVRNPITATQIDFLGDPIVDLPVDGDTVLIDMTPNEMARVVVKLR